MAEGEVAHVKATLRLDTSEARAQLKRDLQVSGNDAGREFTRTFKSATGNTRLPIDIDHPSVVRAGRKAKDTIERQAPTKLRVEVDDKPLAKARADVEKTSQAIASARRLEADAAGNVRVQELRLNELREKNKTRASTLAAAEERLASSHRRLAEAQTALNRASQDHSSSQDNLNSRIRESDLLPDPNSMASLGKELGSAFARGIASPVIGPVLVGTLVTAGAAAAPLIGAAIGAGVLGGLATAGIGAGIALQFQDPEVKFAGAALAHDLKSGFASASSGIKAPLLAAMDAFGQRIDGQLPAFRRMFDQAGQYLTPLGDALGQAFDNSMPGLESALSKSAPVISQIAESLPEIGSAIGDAFDTLGDHSNDIALGIKVISDMTAESIQLAADGVAVLADGMHDVLSLVANVEDLMASTQDPNGWLSQISSLGGLLDPSGQQSKGDDEDAKKWRARADAVRAYLDESDRTNASSQAFTRTQVEATPVLSKMATTIAEAGNQFLELASKAKTPGERINALVTVGKQFAGSTGQSRDIAQQFAGALISEGLAATSAVDRVTALKAAHEILNGTSRAAVDSTESFNSALAGMTLATDTVATAEASRAEAQKSHAAGVATALKQVPTAEAALADAQTRAKEAQLGITQARRDAVQQLKDMKESVSDLANSEEGASISLARARENLTKVNADSKASALDRRQAALDVKVAEDSLSDTQTTRVAKTKELADAEKAGVNGSPDVLGARKAQKDALDAVKTAQDGVKAALDAVTAAQSATEGSTTRTTASLSSHTTAGIANRDMLQNLIKSNEDSYFANIANGDTVEVAKGKYDDQASSIENTAVKAGFNRKEVKKLNTEYGQIPPTKTTALSTSGFEKVFTDLMVAKVIQDGLDANRTKAQIDQEVKNQINVVNNPMAYQYRKDLGYGGKRAGGPIHGPGTGTSDDIPAWLSNGEFVHQAESVDYYGEQAMDAINHRRVPRELIRGFAKGGRAAAAWPMVFDMSNTRIPSAAALSPAGGGSTAGSTASTAFAAAQAMKASAKVLLALFETGIVESGMRNLASRAVPASLKYPHEGVAAGDHDSVGFLQQRASWGSVGSRMNVGDSARRFLRKAMSREKRYDSAGELAQAVQVSAYPSRYNAVKGRAMKMLGLAQSGEGAQGANGTGAGLIAFGRWLQDRGYDVAEHPAFGGVRGRHANGSKHYSGRAIDVNKGSGTSAKEQNYLRQIIPEATKRGFHHIFMSPGHYNHAHFDYAKGGPVRMAAGGLVNLNKRTKGFLEAEEEAAVRKVVSGKGITSRDAELIKQLTPYEVNTLSQQLKPAGFAKLLPKFAPRQRISLETFKASRIMPGVTGLSRVEQEALVDAIDGGKITPAHLATIKKLSYADIINLTRSKVSTGSLDRLRPYLSPTQQAALDSTRLQRTTYAATRAGLTSATRTAITRSAAGKSLTTNQKALLRGLSSPQIAAFKDTMSAGQWSNFQADLTSSQRSDTRSILSGDVTERNKAIAGVPPTAPTPGQITPGMAGSVIRMHPQDIAKIAGLMGAQPVEMYIDKTKMAATSDSLLGRYLTTGVL